MTEYSVEWHRVNEDSEPRYVISVAARMLGIQSHTLRYYERIGLIPPVTRNESGIRDYGELDLRRVSFVKCMRSAGLPMIEFNLWD